MEPVEWESVLDDRNCTALSPGSIKYKTIDCDYPRLSKLVCQVTEYDYLISKFENIHNGTQAKKECEARGMILPINLDDLDYLIGKFKNKTNLIVLHSKFSLDLTVD